MLANHVGAVAGESTRASVNAAFIQPFVTFVTQTRTTFAPNTESTYDWQRNQWTVPINLNVAQLLRGGGQILQVGACARYWANGLAGAPTGWGMRLFLTLLFPR